jgi:hypothetical protein
MTYKTAHRMLKNIRTELTDDSDDPPLSADGATWRQAETSTSVGYISGGSSMPTSSKIG